MSDRELTIFMESVGMSQRQSERAFQKFRKIVSPQPSGYIQTPIITRLIVAHSLFTNQIMQELPGRAKIIVLGNLFHQDLPIPWYWLSRDLATDLDLVDFPETIPQEIVLPPGGIIVLPHGLIKTSTGEVDFIAYLLFDPQESPGFPVSGPGGQKIMATEFTDDRKGPRLVWCAIEGFYAYGGIYFLTPEEKSYRIIGHNAIQPKNSALENQETEAIASILINSLVYASQFESEKTLNPPKTQQSSSKKKRKKVYDRPLFIGGDYVSQVKNLSRGQGASKKIHWRRGHWRETPVGPGKKERAWRMIAPTIVGLKGH